MTTGPADGELVPLGDGPAATVLAGVDERTGEAYAVKVLPGRLDRRTRTGLEDELRALAAVRDEAPILVPDGLTDLADGRTGLRMELCSQSLPELVTAFGPLSVDDVVALGTALAEALTAAHRAGVLHGAVTPGNVLFRSSGEPVLTDFGLTLRRAFPTDPARVLDVLAPETLRDGTIDERSDLYGLGAVLHLALTGRPPHPAALGEPAEERLLRALTEPVPPVVRDDLPPALGDLVAALLAKDPAQRPADAAGVAARLRAMGDAGPAAPQPRGEPLLVFGPRKRSRLRMPAKPAAAVALVAVAGLLFWVNRPDDDLRMPAAAPAPVASAPAGTASAAGPDAADPKAAAALLELAEVTDRGNVVDLAWRSSTTLDFAIIVAAEGRPTRTIFVERVTTYSMPVEPVRKYCFQVDGFDGVNTYRSTPKSIRGAICKQ